MYNPYQVNRFQDTYLLVHNCNILDLNERNINCHLLISYIKNIFDLSGGNLTETADISLGGGVSGGVSGDYFGDSVALDGSRALVGAPYRNGYKGAAYIFEKTTK